MILNYTLEKGHFLLNSNLEVEDEDEIYSFVKQNINDTGVAVYSENDWGDRAERIRYNKDKVFCFDIIMRSDMGQKFTWSIQSRSETHPNIKRKFRYTFALPDFDTFISGYDSLPASLRPSMTEIKDVSYSSPYAQPGEPLCMTINYSLQDGHFLQSMNLEVDANGGTEVYSYSKENVADHGDVINPVNNWGNRIKLTRKDRDKTICLDKIKKTDMDHLFTSTVVSQSLVSPMIRKKAVYIFTLPEPDGSRIVAPSRPLFTKIYGVKFDPSIPKAGRPLCLTVNYTLQDENFLHRLILEVMGDEENKLYSFTKVYPDDHGSIVYFDNNWSNRADKNKQDSINTFCFLEVNEEDLQQTFIWRLQSQNIYHKDWQRTSHYAFNLKGENPSVPTGFDEVLPLETKINGVNFKPTSPRINEPFSIYLDYTLQDGHFLHKASLEVEDEDDENIPMYSLTKWEFNDPGRASYYANDWSARADRTNENLEQPSFTFKNFRRSDIGFNYVWKIISRSIFNKRINVEKSYSFKIPDGDVFEKLVIPPDYALPAIFEDKEYLPNSTMITIHDVTFNPPSVTPGEPLCLTLNYTIEEGSFLRQLLLQADLDEETGIYTYTKQYPNDPGVPFYYDNEWGNRADKQNEELNRTFCFKVANEIDAGIPFIWKVYANDNLDPAIKAKQSQLFALPDSLPHYHYGGFDDRNHVTIELIVGLLVAIVVLLAFLGLFLYFCCCGGCLDKNCTCTPEKSCGKDSEACLAQQKLLYD